MQRDDAPTVQELRGWLYQQMLANEGVRFPDRTGRPNHTLRYTNGLRAHVEAGGHPEDYAAERIVKGRHEELPPASLVADLRAGRFGLTELVLLAIYKPLFDPLLARYPDLYDICRLRLTRAHRELDNSRRG
jgi:hypothetical protein